MRTTARPKVAAAVFATTVTLAAGAAGPASAMSVGRSAFHQQAMTPGLCGTLPAPVAALSVTPTTGTTPLDVIADASASTAGPGCTLSYAFSWGDGTPDTPSQPGSSAMHHYILTGTHTATVTITDDEATPMSNATTASVTVNPVVVPSTNPTAAISVTPNAGTTPLAVTANAGGSKAGTFPIAKYTFKWGDGTPDTGPQTGATAGHTFNTSGTHQVQVVVADNQTPAHTASAGTQVKVGAPTPIPVPAGPTPGLVLTPPGGAGPLTVSADASSSRPGTTPINAYTFDFGDGTVAGPQNGSTTQHTYKNPGTYTVKLTVVDQANLSASTTGQVVVTVPPVVAATVHRDAGADRYATAVAVSQSRWDAATDTSAGARHAGAVVLARGDEFPDALAGIPLAVRVNGPLLLSDPSDVSPTTDAEIRRVLPAGGDIYLLGGKAALSLTVEQHLTADGFVVHRYSGADRFGTALAIAQRGLGDPQHIVVATGDDFPDALAAGPFAATFFQTAQNQPAAVLLSDGTSLPPAVAAYVKTKLVGSTNAAPNVIGIGGPGAAALTTAGPTSQFDALVGADRYDTAAKVAAYFPNNVPVGVASGVNFPDALTGGAMAASLGGPMLLSERAVLSGPTRTALGAVKSGVPSVAVFGGTVALSDVTLNAIAQAVAGKVS